ncbi:MAG: YaaA family protein [Lachnospiraceae bacterium]|nr:YaaA family protein [Lachnospiraceae bacterium]
MRIIISPAKQMRTDTDTIACTETPVFLEKTAILKDWISGLSFDEQKKLWVCNDKIAKQNAARFAGMDLKSSLTPALLAYDGIQYTYMAPAVFEDGQVTYVQEHLRILSGFYGVLKPMDDRCITCIFGELVNGKVVQKGVYAKMARGEMVRFMAGIQAEKPEQIKNFDWSGYQFDEGRSSEMEYVFVRAERSSSGADTEELT